MQPKEADSRAPLKSSTKWGKESCRAWPRTGPPERGTIQGRRARQETIYKVTVKIIPGARFPAGSGGRKWGAPKPRKAKKRKLESHNYVRGPAGLLDTNLFTESARGLRLPTTIPERDLLKDQAAACGTVGDRHLCQYHAGRDVSCPLLD